MHPGERSGLRQPTAKIDDQRLNQLGKSSRLGIERMQPLDRRIRLGRERGVVDADHATFRYDHASADENLVDRASILGVHELVDRIVERHEAHIIKVEQHQIGLVALGDLANDVLQAQHASSSQTACAAENQGPTMPSESMVLVIDMP